MRKVIVGAFVSMDGVMQAPGGPEEDPTGGFSFGGWSALHWDDTLNEFMEEAMAAPYDLLLGRKTYEIFAAHWPFVGPDDPVGEKFNGITKYVATSSAEPLSWQNSVSLGPDGAAAVARLKQGDGPDLLIQGSSNFVQSLLKADLIDQITLMVFPLVLGKGKRLFGDGVKPGAFKMTDSRVSSTGVVIATYQRNGDVQTGSFALEEPTDAERARREKVSREG
jgi:dihydrofolate reductase